MFCPRCGIENNGDARYCRSCGVDLAPVAVALEQTSVASRVHDTSSAVQRDLPAALRKRGQGMRNLAMGAVMLAIALLGGALFLTFAPHTFGGFVLWLAFFGWMAIPGGFWFAMGLGAAVEARTLETAGRHAALAETVPPRLADRTRRGIAANASPTATEQTTKRFTTNEIAEG